jgi:nucleotidyltransferase substrate binding protein (TIGR01987 family)
VTGIHESFAVAVDRLGEALAAPESDLHRDAAIQRFEFSFELSWKAIQKALRGEGIDAASPKGCFREAFRLGWIRQEEPWLSMLEDRNLTSHTYDANLAEVVYRRLPAHLVALRDLAARLGGL